MKKKEPKDLGVETLSELIFANLIGQYTARGIPTDDLVNMLSDEAVRIAKIYRARVK